MRRPGAARRALRGFGAQGPAPFQLPQSSLHLWFEARSPQNTVDVNGDCEVLYDLAGNGNHATVNGAVGDRPHLQTDPGFNNQIVADCDGTAGEWWRIDPFVNGTVAQPNTIYWLGKQIDNSTRVLWDGGTSRQIGYKLSDTNGGYTIAALTNVTSGDATNNPVAVCGVYNGASSEIYVDDMGTAAGTGDAGTNSLSGLTLAANKSGTPYRQTFCFLAIYSERHTQAQREAVIQYLIQEFGVGTPP